MLLLLQGYCERGGVVQQPAFTRRVEAVQKVDIDDDDIIALAWMLYMRNWYE